MEFTQYNENKNSPNNFNKDSDLKEFEKFIYQSQLEYSKIDSEYQKALITKEWLQRHKLKIPELLLNQISNLSCKKEEYYISFCKKTKMLESNIPLSNGYSVI